MPAIGAVLVSICAAVGGVVAGIAGVLAGVLGGIAGVIGGIVSTVGAILGNTLIKIGSGIYSIVSAITMDLVGPIASLVGDIAGTVGAVVGNLGKGLKTAIDAIILPVYKTVTTTTWDLAKLVSDIGDGVVNSVDKISSHGKGLFKVVYTIVDKTATAILTPIKGGLEWIYGAVENIGEGIKTAFHPSARMTELIAENPAAWERSMGLTDIFLADLQDMAVITSTEAFLLTLPDVFNIVHVVGTLKVLDQLLKGQTDVATALTAVGQGQAGQIVAAIVGLSKAIITSSVELLDYVDSNVSILRKQIDSFDEFVRSSLKERIELTKAEVLAAVTPKMTTLGDNQQAVIRGIARISRHLEDEHWFTIMFLRMLR